MGECGLKMAPSSICALPKVCLANYESCRSSRFLPKIRCRNNKDKGGFESSTFSRLPRVVPRAVGDAHRQRSSLESLFCYDKPIPEEIIEKPVGVSMAEKNVGDNPRCPSCQAKGAILCTTCSGSGLYVDSILESQGIIVKVRCLGCGGTGNTMCSECGGRGHI